ncbi:hypothetical protein [Martelella soudanensis]|uniref:hypothetical protein n=1 Tax=unclassified Martelella TaxID=2629616 RepID=UPI0015DEC9B9|nr:MULTISPECIES: hypothetical protein [unclassified Martelella]
MFPHRTPRHQPLRLLAAVLAGSMLTAPSATLAQSAPSVHSDDPFSLMRGTQQPGEKRPVKLEARLAEGGNVMRDGLFWRVFTTIPDTSGRLRLVASAEGGTKTIELSPGDYFISCAFGRASATRKVRIAHEAGRPEQISFVLNAGGLMLNARLGDGKPARAGELSFSVYEDNGDRRELVAEHIAPGSILRLRAGTYDVVSSYGTLNAETHARLKVKAGEITDAKLKVNAAEVTLKLAGETGGEALADTAWTILGASGDVLTESSNAMPTMILAEGSYTAVARNQDSLYEKTFTVSSSGAEDVELLLSRNKANTDTDGFD